MSSLYVGERRQSPRCPLGLQATIKPGLGTEPRCCIVTNISDQGVRIRVDGIKSLDEFVLIFPSDTPARDGTYKVVWGNNRHDFGARFLSAAT